MGLKKLSSAFILSGLLLQVTACGGGGGGGSSSAPNREPIAPPQERQEEVTQKTEGIYRAVLVSLNSNLPHETVGTVTIKISGDDFEAQSVVNGAPANTKHFQFINVGTKCPEMSDDTNNDSFIDIVEAQKKTGHILIPLDGKLSNQFEGFEYGPIANARGAYVYKRSTALSLLEGDLTAPDVSSNDGFSKLHTGEQLNLSGRVVTIHGSGSALPSSIGTLDEMSVRESFPIACGRLVRLSDAEERVVINEPAPAPTVEDDSL